MCRLYLPLNVFWLRSAFSVISRLNRLQMIKSGINSEREDYFSATWRQWSLSGLTRLFSEDSTSLPWRDNYGRFFLIERPRYFSHRLQLRGLKFGFKNLQHKMNRWFFHHLVFHVIYDKIFDLMPWRVFHFFINILHTTVWFVPLWFQIVTLSGRFVRHPFSIFKGFWNEAHSDSLHCPYGIRYMLWANQWSNY